MKAEQITEALEQAATQINVRVRYETMTGDTAGSGGLWAAEPHRQVSPSDSRERRAHVVDELEAKFLRIELDGRLNIIHQVSDGCHSCTSLESGLGIIRRISAPEEL